MAFELNPGGSDFLTAYHISDNKLYFAFVAPGSQHYQPYYYDGSETHAIPLPAGVKLYGITFFPGDQTEIYFIGWNETGQKVLVYNGNTTTLLNPAPGAHLDSSLWTPWGIHGGRFYFTASTPDNKLGLYSYKSDENGGQPFEVRVQKGMITQALLPTTVPFQANMLPRTASQDFITLEDDDTWKIFSLGGASSPNPVQITGSFGTLSNNTLHQSGLLGVCFNTASGQTFCIDRNTHTAVPTLTGSNGTYPVLIDAGASSVYYLKGAYSSGSPRLVWSDGSTYDEIELESATRSLDQNLIVPVGGKILFAAFDSSAEGKSLCPNGTKRIFSFDKSSGQIQALTNPKPCLEGMAYSSNPLASQVAATSTQLFFLEDATPGRPDYGALLGFQVVRSWNGSSLETVPSSNPTPYLAMPYSNVASTLNHAYTTLSTPAGLKLYRISENGTAGDWEQVSNVVSGGSDEILWGSICAVDQGVLYTTYHQAQSGGGTGSTSKLWLYREQSASTELIHTLQDSWGLLISLPCIKLGTKMVIQIYNVHTGWESKTWDGTHLSSITLSGDAVTNSSTPLPAVMNSGFLGAYGAGQLFQWQDSDGNSKLYWVNESGVTQKISNLNPGGGDEIHSLATAGDRIFIAAVDPTLSSASDTYLSVYSIHQGVTVKHNFSIQVMKTVNGEAQKTGNSISLFGAENSIYVIESQDAKYEFPIAKIHSWNGSTFTQLEIPEIRSLSFYLSKGNTAYLSGFDSSGKRQIYALNGGALSLVNFVASVPDLQLSEPILYSGPGSSLFLLNYQGDDVMRMIKLGAP